LWGFNIIAQILIEGIYMKNMPNQIKCSYCGEWYSSTDSDNFDGQILCPFCGSATVQEKQKNTTNLSDKTQEILSQFSLLRSIGEFGNENLSWDEINISKIGSKDRVILQNIAKSIEDLTLIERKSLGNAILWFRLGRIMEAFDDPTRAMIFYQASVIYDDSLADAWWNIGILTYYQKNDLHEAIQYLEKSISLSKGIGLDDDDWSLLAELQKKAGNFNKATEYLQMINTWKNRLV
jgi:tetratricopeptide (TPR) repeat protein